MKQLRQYHEWRRPAETFPLVSIQPMCDGVHLALGLARQIPASGLEARLNGKDRPHVTLWVLIGEAREVKPGKAGEIVAESPTITLGAGRRLKIQERYLATGTLQAT